MPAEYIQRLKESDNLFIQSIVDRLGVCCMKRGRRFKIRYLLLLLFLLYFSYTIVFQQIKSYKLSIQEAELEEQIKIAIEERDRLKREIELLHTDDYIEKIARDELGLVKSGEFIYKRQVNSKN
jgi:cell division protein DivIC